MRIWGLIVVLLMGCKADPPAPPAQPAPPVRTAPAPEAQAPPSDAIESEMFALKLVTKDAYRAGHPGAVSVELEGRGGWHVNQDYPFKVTVSAAPGVKLDKDVIAKADAQEFTDDRVRAEVGVTPSAAGDHDVECLVAFAMCTDENCVIEKRTVAATLAVNR